MIRAIMTVALAAMTLTAVTEAAAQGQSGALVFAEKIAPVLTHPRCLNCHTITTFPRQGDERRRHDFLVVRGPRDNGAPAMQCVTCHQANNHTASGVPGAPHWQLAPLSMGWEGLGISTLCKALKDPRKNGNRDLAKLVQHMTNDPLVLWGWAPGGDRTPVPIAHADFSRALGEWVNSGAACPD
ncbi:MAG: hypothetical protein ACKVQU_26015 [Burkholderiales bacterium]